MQEEWLTVKQCAMAAGVSQRTVWRWVKAGECVSRVSDTTGRPIRQVRRGSWPAPTDTGAATPTPEPHTAPVPSVTSDSVSVPASVTGADPALAAVLGALVQEVAHLRAAVERQDATIRELRALPAPNIDAPALTDELRELRSVVAQQAEELAGLRQALETPTSPPDAVPAPIRRPWWRLW